MWFLTILNAISFSNETVFWMKWTILQTMFRVVKCTKHWWCWLAVCNKWYLAPSPPQIPVINIQMKIVPAICTFLGAIFSCTNYFRVIFTGGVGKNGSTIAVSLQLTCSLVPDLHKELNRLKQNGSPHLSLWRSLCFLLMYCSHQSSPFNIIFYLFLNSKMA